MVRCGGNIHFSDNEVCFSCGVKVTMLGIIDNTVHVYLHAFGDASYYCDNCWKAEGVVANGA